MYEGEHVDYSYDYYHAGVTGVLTESFPEFIGKADAIDEWIDEKTAEANFINIDSYSQFAEPSCVFLVGRIGSGKTAMLNKLKYSIEKGNNEDYAAVNIIDTRDYIAQLGKMIRIAGMEEFNYTEIEYTARKEWEKTINTIAMKTIYDKYASVESNTLKKIETYLSEQNILSSKMKIANVIERISENLGKIDTIQAQGLSTAGNILGQLFSASYDDAVDEMKNILVKHGKILLLIDSIEKYEFSEKIILAVLNALVNICLDYNRENKYIEIKMAAPSELIPRLTAINPEKISSKIVYIRWSHDDLKSFLAVRIYKYVNRIAGAQYIEKEVANKFFDDYYGKFCITRCNINFPVFPYCLSYTQKEPRQLLAIFNAWLFLEQRYPETSRQDLIEKAINSDDLSRVKGALSIYSSVHTKMFEMFERTFSNRRYCFNESQLDEWLNSCANIRGDLDAYDLKKYFISSGLVGTMVELHFVEADNKILKPGRNVRIKEVVFEYQYKECLPFNSDTKFCLHPMVFGALNIEVDRNTFVYPKPLELDDEFVPWDDKEA